MTTIVTRSGKGTSLSWSEVDSNFTNLNTDKAPIASPTFTGVPSADTAVSGTNTTQLATTAFVTTADNLKANLASPALTGTPTAPTATSGTNTTQIATTAFVQGKTATQTPFTAVGNLVATDVQAAIAELDNEKTAKGPAFRATQSVLQQVTANIADLCVFTTETFDINNCYSTASSTFTPNIAGYYQINAAAGNFVTGSAFGVYLSLYKNGTLYSEGGKVSSGTNSYAAATVSDVIYCNGTSDYINVLVTGIAASGTLNVKGQYFSGSLVRSV